MNLKIFKHLLVLALLFPWTPMQAATDGPVRVLFLGHAGEHHPSDKFFPMISQALGRDAIYFDYVRTVEEALGNADYLNRFDALLLYANHATIEPHQWNNLKQFVESGKGFLPIHCASWCFSNEPGFDKLVGARFKSHQTGVFTPRTLLKDHPAIRDVPAMEAWDETYFHNNHHPEGRTVLQVRDAMPGDPHKEPEPWTWVREQGKGRVFYTASGHDERVWSRPEFHTLLKKGILWSIGKDRLATYEGFLAKRTPLSYEKRDYVPNYEKRPEPLPYQFPLSAADSMDYTQVPVGFRLELFASEPDIVNPIAMAWDERGRLWVAESVDYPNELTDSRKGNDSIKILEDTDGDGRCDKVTVFADGLNVPTSLVFANGGLIVAHAPEFLFFKDTNGDDRADVRQVLNDGWGIKDTHAGPSNLRYGLDNHVWGTVGYSGYNMDGNRFGQGVFRMQQDGSGVEFLHQFNNNTWGLGFNELGDVFGSTANNNPSFFGGFPATGYGNGARGVSATMIADSRSFHPITPNIRQVDAFGNYTAGAGHAIATSDTFPEAWQNKLAFVCGPTGNLLGSFKLERKGSGYEAHNHFSIVASADEWFSPVAAEVGPDGNLWIADWYNFIIQHNPTPSPQRGGFDGKNGRGNAHINPNRDRQHGRIYRMVREGAPEPRIKDLSHASEPELIAALGDGNQFWRLTAQRLLVEKGQPGDIQILRKAVLNGGVQGIHALWTLKGLGKLDREIHQAALLSADNGLKQNAIRAIDASQEGIQLFIDTAVMTATDLHVRREAFTKMAHFPKSDAFKVAIPQLFKDKVNREDPWLSIALKAAADRQGSTMFKTSLGPNLLPSPGFEQVENNSPAGWHPHRYQDRGGTSLSVASGKPNVRNGNHSLMITSGAGADAGWRVEVPVKPNTDYRLSGFIKTGWVSGAKGALLNIHGHSQGVTPALTKIHDWTEVEVFFNSENRSSVMINCLFGGWGTSTGTAWYDDVALQEVTMEATTAESAILEGDATRGRQIFREHPVASCIRCHQVDGEGGFVGPYMDGIAKRKQPDYIRESILDPQAQIAEGFPAEVSPMPPFGVLLKPQEIEDIMAYLMTLTKEPDPSKIKKPEMISFE